MFFPIILVAPARAENVGAAARAMKTMGFTQLRIVNSQVHLEPAAQWTAHGATDILDNVETFSTLQEALADIDFSIATTARSRAKFRYYATPTEVLEQLSEKRQWMNRFALVFGCEESGLSNADLECVDLLTGIPMAVDYPSLNLGQAVMVFCYQLSSLHLQAEVDNEETPSQPLRALRERISHLLDKIDVSNDQKLVDWLDQRLGFAQSRDTAMLHRLVQDIEKKLSK
ncbi:tRNA/rRNA methyltransferase [Rosenbergiella australiborealis]|uniref:tRNA (cytidine/uridine-2'-O-)-methyltransferase TrmJ n=1 Tax=Rosenbergiella australiborealis TaxID=1544696 RepID=A0ABS5T1B1_9GAMM|nr:tRNA/rRNA methyltransferase [Rosenbergiella australiborealis]MBT0726129.1 tRNA/rRNA methyltransferase [Rosenbergiella australiborealis]